MSTLPETFQELLDAGDDEGSRLLGMYYAAWQREFNLPPSEVVLVETEGNKGKTYWYLAGIEEFMEETGEKRGGEFPDIEEGVDG